MFSKGQGTWAYTYGTIINLTDNQNVDTYIYQWLIIINTNDAV